MLGLNNLKAAFSMTESEVECPVQGCNTVVRRRRRGDKEPRNTFLCKACNINVFPSTFEYVNEADNLLWTAKDDVGLLDVIKKYKAETRRLGHDNSEDAVTWNVFRHFDRSKQSQLLLSHLTGRSGTKACEVIYWSFSPVNGRPWQPLVEARLEFGEAATPEDAKYGKNKVSEPDLILLTDDELIFVEAKFGSGNKTPAKLADAEARIKKPKRYLIGGNEWYAKVIENSFEMVMRDQKYELLRFWLLGSWMADRLGKRFVLANLVPRTKETAVEHVFGRHIRQTERRSFVRWEWESLEPLLENQKDYDSLRLLAYLRNKTLGFAEDKVHRIARPKRAFSFA